MIPFTFTLPFGFETFVVRRIFTCEPSRLESAGSQTSPMPSSSMSLCPGLASAGQLSTALQMPSPSGSGHSVVVVVVEVGAVDVVNDDVVEAVVVVTGPLHTRDTSAAGLSGSLLVTNSVPPIGPVWLGVQRTTSGPPASDAPGASVCGSAGPTMLKSISSRMAL